MARSACFQTARNPRIGLNIFCRISGSLTKIWTGIVLPERHRAKRQREIRNAVTSFRVMNAKSGCRVNPTRRSSTGGKTETRIIRMRVRMCSQQLAKSPGLSSKLVKTGKGSPRFQLHAHSKTTSSGLRMGRIRSKA